MDNQYTPIYHNLWNRDFSLLIVAEILLCMSCYMTIPLLPYRLLSAHYADAQWASMAMVVFVAGIGLSGLFGSWVIQRYRRNKVFVVSALCLGAMIAGLSLFDNPQCKQADTTHTAILMGVCAACGIAFGQAKRVLSCTLLIDKTESCHRTEANYTAIWIARLTVVAGPITALLLRREIASSTLFYAVAATAALVSTVLVMTVKFPFRAPEEGTHFISTDRFFLTGAWNIALVIALMAAALGMMLASRLSTKFCTSLAVGLALAIVTLRYQVVRNGRYTSAVGNICTITALAVMALHNGMLDDTLKPMVLGLGFGLTSSEQLYKLLGHSDHCQRSTAESTYFMSSDGGLFLGIAASWWMASLHMPADHTALALAAAGTIVCSANILSKKKQAGHHA